MWRDAALTSFTCVYFFHVITKYDMQRYMYSSFILQKKLSHVAEETNMCAPPALYEVSSWILLGTIVGMKPVRACGPVVPLNEYCLLWAPTNRVETNPLRTGTG